MKKPEQLREIRGWMLWLLREYALDVSPSTIRVHLLKLGYVVSEEEVLAELRYLAEKGFVRMEEAKDSELKISMQLVHLTPKGRDLLEHSVSPDPGITLMG